MTTQGLKCKRRAVQDGKCSAHFMNTCAICIEPVKLSDRKLACRHRYHTKCIMKWFETSIECPVCRMEQDADPLVVFRMNVEDNLRAKYNDAIRTLELEIRRLKNRNGGAPETRS